jgi:hypothetical protein
LEHLVGLQVEVEVVLKMIVEQKVKVVGEMVDLNQAEQMQQLLAKKTPEVEVEVEAIPVEQTFPDNLEAPEL